MIGKPLDKRTHDGLDFPREGHKKSNAARNEDSIILSVSSYVPSVGEYFF